MVSLPGASSFFGMTYPPTKYTWNLTFGSERIRPFSSSRRHFPNVVPWKNWWGRVPTNMVFLSRRVRPRPWVIEYATEEGGREAQRRKTMTQREKRQERHSESARRLFFPPFLALLFGWGGGGGEFFVLFLSYLFLGWGWREGSFLRFFGVNY